MKTKNQPVKGIFYILIMLSMIGTLCLPTPVVAAQSVDDGFNPSANANVLTIVVQPDGMVLVGGAFSSMGGQVQPRLARLHPDGSLDTSFAPDLDVGFVTAIALQSDNKILIGGIFTQIGGVAQAYLARLHPNGSLDTTFNPVLNDRVNALVVQPDGKILVGGSFAQVSGQNRTAMVRLNANGSLDAAFNPGISGTNPFLSAIALQPDGRILIGGSFNQVGGEARSHMTRLNADGSLDTSFHPRTANNTVNFLAVQPDGRILLSGAFSRIDGVDRLHMARLNYDGTLDLSFNPTISGSNLKVDSLTPQPDGMILVGGRFTELCGVPRNNLGRLDPNGDIDMGFNPNVNNIVYSLAVQPDGKILLGGIFSQVGGTDRNRIARLYPDGSLDATADPGANNLVSAIALQPDGKILVAGLFTTFGGQPRQRIARLHPNGSLDAAFTPVVNDGAVATIAVQPDGKILIGGSFTQVAGQTRNHIARLNANGSLDAGFNPNTNGTVETLALYPDGRILIGGDFTQVGSTIRNHIARLQANGNPDSMNPNANGKVRSIVLQPDSKILVGGDFTTIREVDVNRIARLTFDGGWDDGFDPGTGIWAASSPRVSTIALQADGKILIGGIFSQVDGTPRFNLARLNSNGSLDDPFQPDPDGFVSALAVQADGKIIVGGGYSQIDRTARFRLARLLPGGSLDNTFTTQVTIPGNVISLAVQPDGKTLVGGSFSIIGGEPRDWFARLSTTDAAFQTLDATRDKITWTRSGPGPELLRAAFSYSTDGVNYTALGVPPVRVGDSWQLSTLSLPVGINLFIRAQGIYPGTRSESVVESVRQVFFGPLAFTKVSPVYDQDIVPLTPTLEWSRSSSDASYQYCLGTTSGACDVIAWTDNGTHTSVTLNSPLSPETGYFWQVRASSGEGTTLADSGDWWTFTTGNPPGAFNKTAPANGVTVQTFTPTFSWNPSSGATGYEFCIGSAIGQCNRVPKRDVGPNTVYTIETSLLPDTTYYWQVWAYNNDGQTSANLEAWWSFTTYAAPRRFNKVSPSNGATNVPQHNWRFIWDHSDNIDRFEYCLGTINGECNYIDWTSTGTNITALIEDMAPHTEYFWQVRAINAHGTTYANQGTWHSFTTSGMVPGAFSLIAPADEATDQPLSLTFSWTSAELTDHYEFCLISDVEDGDCNVINYESTGLEQSKTVSNLIPNHTYGWRVRAVNAEGHRYAIERSFTTGDFAGHQIFLPLIQR